VAAFAPDKMHRSLERFYVTITKLPWSAIWDEMEGTPQPPFWMPHGVQFVAAAAAKTFLKQEDAEALRAEVEAICQLPPGRDQTLVDQAVRRAQQAIDMAVDARMSAAERRVASQAVATARARWYFADADEPTNEASLVVSVAALELLLGELVRAFYHRYPDALRGMSRSLTVPEVLDALDGGQDLRERLIDEALNQVIGRSPRDVRAWFEGQRPLKLDFDRNCFGSFDELAEIFERRHTIVHGGTVVDDKYHAMVAGAPPVGSSLRVASDYIVSAFDRILAFGISLFAEVWTYLFPSDTLAVATCVVDLMGRVQYLWDRYHDPWPTLMVLADTLVRIGESAEGPDAEGINVLARLIKLRTAWNAATVDGIHPQETISNWVPGPSVVERFALAVLRQDDSLADSLVDDSLESPAFAVIALLPLDFKVISEAVTRLRLR
jgi:hypothetical protein